MECQKLMQLSELLKEAVEKGKLSREEAKRLFNEAVMGDVKKELRRFFITGFE